VSVPPSRRQQTPPGFLRLAGHPVRWQLLSELAQTDLRVGELCSRLQLHQSLVSYHLAQLRSGQMVTRRRSSADGRDSYYLLDLERCIDLLTAIGAELHPGLKLIRPQAITVRAVAHRPARVLFSCTGNSARSQIAEALAEQMGNGRIVPLSAGSHPKPLHPNAVRVMREHGIDLTGRSSKPLSRFSGKRFDYIITLCDRVREVCPEFPGNPGLIHWSTPDPAREGDTDADTYPAFRRTAAELETRIGFLINSIGQATTGTPSRADPLSAPRRTRR
jgi:ArsR family transcriptional regulator, arsenate/arsenite/antimonite-responsive transcriptional repressor / arsenate reductase (thioredoxin)